MSPADVVELDALPLAERRRAAAQVDDDVEHPPARARAPACPGPGCVWKWMPRSVPWREREWLSCTKSVGMPYRRAASARKVSTKKPRSSPWTVGASRTSPSSRVSSRCIAGRRLGSDRRKDASPCRGPPPCPRPPAAIRRFPTYISARFDEFSRSQKDVAQYVVDHLDEVAFHTAEELARRANTSSSTVVRFSQALGFEGFPELQEAAREEYRHHHRDGARRRRRQRRCSASTSHRSSRPSRPITSTSRTRRAACRRSEVDGAIEAIAAAERILIAGTDQMAFFASYLRHLLMLLDVRAEIAASPSPGGAVAGSAGSTSARW